MNKGLPIIVFIILVSSAGFWFGINQNKKGRYIIGVPVMLLAFVSLIPLVFGGFAKGVIPSIAKEIVKKQYPLRGQ